MEDWKPEPGAKCQKCGTEPAGPGGILCAACKVSIERANADLIAGRTGEPGPGT